MDVVATLPADTQLSEVAARAAQAERLGFDVLHVSETIHDPFVISALALEHTEKIRVRTSMVVAFPRSPMVTAYSAWDLAKFSSGRFDLGLATQVRGNIVGRYSSTWENPVTQLRDYVLSLRAIFSAFQSGEDLNHEGPHYRFDRLQPFFNPGPLDVSPPAIWTGGINPQMCALAGEIADGIVCHPAASHPRFIDERIRPALEQGAAKAGRSDRGPAVVANAQPVTGRTEADVVRAREAQRETSGFLYATPAYARQLELFGLAEISEQLTAMAQVGDWSGLESVLTDGVIDLLFPVGTYAELPALLGKWYAGRCDAIIVKVPDSPDDEEEFSAVVASLQALPTRGSQ